jgi:hypothetical protein
MIQMSDSDVWEFIEPDDLWIYDKLILSKKLGYTCGPAGTQPKRPGEYIVRPCVNFMMMGHGAKIEKLHQYGSTINVPPGYFWCERFYGRHLSFDFQYGKQVLAVEGFKDDESRLDRFSKWQKCNDVLPLPAIFDIITKKYEWLNVEVIGNKIIEVHLRYNDDFRNHDASTIIPIWKDQFYPSECGDRLGFLIYDKEIK